MGSSSSDRSLRSDGSVERVDGVGGVDGVGVLCDVKSMFSMFSLASVGVLLPDKKRPDESLDCILLGASVQLLLDGFESHSRHQMW